MRGLKRQGYSNLLLRTQQELDLLDAHAVAQFFAQEKPEYVFLAAAKVGGILANNTYPADFIRDNLILQTNVIEASRQTGVQRLLFLGSSCIYPKLAPQPMPRVLPADRAARADQPSLCAGQDRRHRDVLGL